MGGAPWSHIQIADQDDTLHAAWVDVGMADLVLARDMVVASQKSTLSIMQPGRTSVMLGIVTLNCSRHSIAGANCSSEARRIQGEIIEAMPSGETLAKLSAIE